MKNSMELALRYDMRAPRIAPDSPTPEELYRTAVEQCRWADGLGFETVYLAEHHGAEDGYCPSPMILASAILSRTQSIRAHFSALLAVRPGGRLAPRPARPEPPDLHRHEGVRVAAAAGPSFRPLNQKNLGG